MTITDRDRTAYFREYARRNREKRKANLKRWAAANRDHVNAYARAWQTAKRRAKGIQPRQAQPARRRPAQSRVAKPSVGISPKASWRERFLAYRQSLLQP